MATLFSSLSSTSRNLHPQPQRAFGGLEGREKTPVLMYLYVLHCGQVTVILPALPRVMCKICVNGFMSCTMSINI